MKRLLLSALSAAALFGTSAAAPIDLVSHRAQYDVTLSSTRPGGIVAVHGRTVVEFRDVCNAWTTTQRFIADMTDSKGGNAHTDFIVFSSEDKPGKIMRFKIRNLVNGKTTQRFEGTSRVASAGGEVSLTSPAGEHFALPTGTVLPTQLTLAVLRAARAGIHSFRQTVFQGGDRNDLYDATAVIGKPASQRQRDEDRAADIGGLLNGVGAWPALVSYFPHGSDDERADYEIAYRLYANGVIAAMTLIYPNFTMKADLVRLEKLPSRCRAAAALR
ncbi:MAG TPA: DUF1849 family protein [Rhizomicrobium sp.]|nr:DUF1849 family protein [Rhizomicrobium sp.]